MYRNSTIRPKPGICPFCPPGSKPKPLIKGKCETHYWEQIRLKSALKAQEKELAGDEDLQTLVDHLDIIFSQYIRLKDVNDHGEVECYTCPTIKNWKHMQCGHFIPRANMYTRFSEENCKQQCPQCNMMEDGNLVAFAEHLERDRPGSVEILREQANIVQRYSREELKAMIGDYTRKVKELKAKVIYQ